MSHDMTLWIVRSQDGEFFVALVERASGYNRLVRQHPIPFENSRDAERAAVRLNARDERAASSLHG